MDVSEYVCVCVSACVCECVSGRRLIGRATLLSNAYRSDMQPFPERILQSPHETLLILAFSDFLSFFLSFFLSLKRSWVDSPPPLISSASFWSSSSCETFPIGPNFLICPFRFCFVCFVMDILPRVQLINPTGY